MTLRAGRADLAERLNKTADRASRNPQTTTEVEFWDRVELSILLAEARDAILHCPVEGCAYCYTIEQQETTR